MTVKIYCQNGRLQRTKTDRRFLLLLDEFANLGYMANLKEAVSLGGGYGLTLWLVLQDLAQLHREYKDEIGELCRPKSFRRGVSHRRHQKLFCKA